MSEKNKKSKTSVKVPKKYIIALIIVSIIALGAIGMSAYMYINTPNQIRDYVQAHKEDLRGEKGEDGIDGMDGIDGADGSDGANGYSGGLNCSSYNIGDRTYTNCN